MKTLILQPDEIKRIPVGSAKWLVVRESQEFLYVRSDNGERIRVDAGDTLDISQFKEMDVSNPHASTISAVFQLSKQQITVTPPAKVKFAESMAISEVRSVVPVSQQIAQRFVSPDHVKIKPLEKVRLLSASAVRFEAIIQNISETETEAMIGDVNVSAVTGLPILGDRKAPAGMTITGGGELWAYNNGNAELKIAVLEVHQ